MSEHREPKLLDRVRSAIRVRHYSGRTEKAYVCWVRRSVLFHGWRLPNLALSALLFLNREVLETGFSMSRDLTICQL